jgi:hypothetical protein
MQNFLVKTVYAQTAPINGTPIQRTIEEVNEEGKIVTEVTSHQGAQAGSQKGVLLGLGAILLILIAVVAVVKLWQNNLDLGTKKGVGSRPAKPKPRTAAKTKAGPRVQTRSSSRKT